MRRTISIFTFFLLASPCLAEIVSVPVFIDMPAEFKQFGGCIPTSDQIRDAHITNPSSIFVTVSQRDPKFKGFNLRAGQTAQFVWTICNGTGNTPVMPGFFAYYNGNMTGTLTATTGQEWDLVVGKNTTGYRGQNAMSFVNANPTTVVACSVSSDRGPRVPAGTTWTIDITAVNGQVNISYWGYRFETWYEWCK